jgi:hypothetical protein
LPAATACWSQPGAPVTAGASPGHGPGDRQPHARDGAGLPQLERSGAAQLQQPHHVELRLRGELRDPFTAFVCDDATAELLRPIAVEHGWAPEKVNKGGLRNAVQSLSVSASPNILFVDLSESAIR